MPNPLDRIRAFFGGTVKAAKTQAPYAQVVRSNILPNANTRKGAQLLRNFAENNEWVRMAINRRKRQIAQAKWKIVRRDNPKLAPDKRVVAQVNELFRFVNPKRESFRSLLDQIIEDLLVLDAGCVEKEMTLGGGLVALWPVDGATIVPDATWNGSQPNAIRYRQYIGYRLVAELKNDELLYMMANPRTYSPIGLSPVEVLVRVIEAELYGEEYDFDALKQTAPEGILDLGRGVLPSEVDAFREYYEREVAGTKSLAIFGGGAEAGVGGAVTYNAFKPSNREQQRMEYKRWLAVKIAGVFEMDLLAFNLTEGVNRANGKNMQQATDAGHVGLATLIAEFIEREIIYSIDPTFAHGFEFEDLTDRDEKAEVDIETSLMSIGATTPNEVRARRGEDPYPNSVNKPEHWANLPYPFNQDTGTPQTSPDGSDEDDDDPNADGPGDADGKKPTDDAEDANKGVGPFVQSRAGRQTADAKLDYLRI